MFNFEKQLGGIKDKINKTVNESKMPTKDYESTVGVYGGKLKTEKDGKMVWDNKGIISKIDKFGDAILRNYDEHIMKNPGKFFKRNPLLFFKFIMPGTKRYRGNKEEIFENIQKLRLTNYYDIHKNGIEIKDKKLFMEGVILQDVFRADLIDNEKLSEIDKHQAVSEASKYLRTVHQDCGAIGEVLPSDFIFKVNKDKKVENPVLNIPDIIFNPKKETGDREKKATDLLDFVISLGAEEFRASQDEKSVKKIMKNILDSYNDPYIINLMKSFIKRGRLTLSGDRDSEIVDIPNNTFTTKNRGIFTKHNEARIVNDTKLEALLKKIALEVCEDYK